MRRWDLSSIDVEPHQPEVLQSEAEGRTIAIHLPAGERLQEHQVHERTWLVVIDGSIQLTGDGETEEAGPGTLAVFDPGEPHELKAASDARLLLVLAPWPGEGHPRRRGESA